MFLARTSDRRTSDGSAAFEGSHRTSPGLDSPRQLCVTALVLAFFLPAPAAEPPEVKFIRGDADQDGQITNSDILIIGEHFYIGTDVDCVDALDADDNGIADTADASYLFTFLHAGGPAPPPPFAEQGFDPTTDQIHCYFYDSTSDPHFVTPKLVITNKDNVLTNAGLTFEAVMNKIVSTAGTGGMGQTALSLYQQWWRDLGPPSCPQNLNGFPNTCGRAEAALGSTNPFLNPNSNPDSYVPVAVFNRFDSAPSDCSTCGSYRIVFGKRSGFNTVIFNRNLIIFEAEMPNPTSYSNPYYPGSPPGPGQMSGCMPLLQSWNELEGMTPAQQSARLNQMFLVGYGGMPPIIHANHLGGYYGQIRTNTFMEDEQGNAPPWILREFKVQKACSSGGSCELRVVRQQPVTNNPHSSLFSFTASPFQPFWTDFLNLIAADKLAATSFTYINLGTTFQGGPYNAPQSLINQPMSNYNLNCPSGGDFRTAIAQRASTYGLSADNVLDRATSMTCAGCHGREVLSPGLDLGNGIQRPRSMGFQHVNEYGVLSHGLRTVFLPARRARWDQIFGGGGGPAGQGGCR